MIPYPQIDPDLIRIGPLHIRWYGLMYVLGFTAAYFLIRTQRKAKEMGLAGDQLQELVFSAAVGLIVGARLGYILFYQFANLMDYVRNPLEIIAVWHGGMSFHGGLAGTLLAGTLFCRSRGLALWKTADIVVVTAPVGLFFGRIGNFINAELFGRVTTAPWGMLFPGAGPLPRHPSQIYEALLEGVVLFSLLWRIKDRPMRPGALVCIFLCGYGVLRFVAEFFREPDPQIGLFWGIISMGQVLCSLMIAAGLLLWWLLPQESGDA